jgi:hypothetical protein
MDVRLEDGTWGKTEKLVKVGDTVTLDICDDNGNNIEVSGVIAEVGK